MTGYTPGLQGGIVRTYTRLRGAFFTVDINSSGNFSHIQEGCDHYGVNNPTQRQQAQCTQPLHYT